MKTKIEIKGDTTEIHKKQPTIVIHSGGKKRTIRGKTAKIGDTTHIYLQPEKEKEHQQKTKEQNAKAKNIFEEERKKYAELKKAQEEAELRKQIRESLAKLDAAREAIKRHKFLVLLRGSEKFRNEVGWIAHPTDPFKNVWYNKISKLSEAEKNRIREKARKASKEWEKGTLLKKYEPELQKIEERHPELIKKLNMQSLYTEIGEKFERFCDKVGLSRIGIKLNPAELRDLIPFLTSYREDIAKMRYLALTNGIKTLKKYEKEYQEHKNKLEKLKKSAAYFEQQQNRK
jgi:hypothetical protein